jgi:hypothetical protein
MNDLLSTMQKSLHLLTPEEKATLVARLKEDAEGEKYFTGVLGNRNSIMLPKPLPRRGGLSGKLAKAMA